MRVNLAQTARKRSEFRALHQAGCFVLPNPWDAGSAVALAGMGFKALGTTSSGHAWSQARADGHLTRGQTLAHMRYMAEVSDLPINADFESGFGATADDVAESVRMAVETGVAGLSIEDASGNPDAPLRPLAESVARMRAARAAIDSTTADTLLVGRAENFFVGVGDLANTIERLQAYAAAGADCLYAPGIQSREQIAAVVAAVAPKPVNVLMGGASGLTLQDLAGLGVRRVSVGGALARSAWAGFLGAARAIAKEGRFDVLAQGTAGQELNALFTQSLSR